MQPHTAGSGRPTDGRHRSHPAAGSLPGRDKGHTGTVVIVIVSGNLWAVTAGRDYAMNATSTERISYRMLDEERKVYPTRRKPHHCVGKCNFSAISLFSKAGGMAEISN